VQSVAAQSVGSASPPSLAKQALPSQPPRIEDESKQDIVDLIWTGIIGEVETRMVAMETEMIKRHNVKMMNEMLEVVRQIKSAKAKNDEVLRDYHKKHTEIARSVADLGEKYLSLRSDTEDIKRTLVATKQQLTLRCDQSLEQVSQLKQSVVSTWKQEKQDMQANLSASLRNDMTSVLSQCDLRLKENFAETASVRHELKRIMAKLSGEDPDRIPLEPTHPAPSQLYIVTTHAFPGRGGCRGCSLGVQSAISLCNCLKPA